MNFEDDIQEDFWQPPKDIEVLEDVNIEEKIEIVRLNKIN